MRIARSSSPRLRLAATGRGGEFSTEFERSISTISLTLSWVTTLDLLPIKEVIFGNPHARPENPQLIEVTRDKKVVWTFKDFQTFGNNPVAALVLTKGRVIR